MHHHLGSFDAHEAPDGGPYDSASAVTGQHAGLPHADAPSPADDPLQAAGPFDHGPALGGFPAHDAALSAQPSTNIEVHVDHIALVSAHDIGFDSGPHGEPHHDESHHDLLSLAKDTGWLAPASPLMLFAGTTFAGVFRRRLKRLAAERSQDLEAQLARGERVVVTVDGDELDRACGRGDRLTERRQIPGQGVERPVEVVAIDAGHEGARTVVLDDLGGPLGRRSVPLPAFETAWERHGRQAFADAPHDAPEAE
jgi:hypothetical protein